MGLSLRGTTSGAIDINAPAVAGDNTITLPGNNGSANQFFKNSGTAGIVTYSSMVETTTGVGIGTANPQKTLHVNSTSADSFGIVRISGRNRGGQLEFCTDATKTAGIYSPTSSNELVFFTSSSETERLRITSDGKVGIGTANPGSTQLKIETGSGTRAISLNAPTNGTYITFETAGTAYADIGAEKGVVGSGSADTPVINARGSRDLAFRTNNAERLRIDSSGRVTMPYQPLAIMGTTQNNWTPTAGDVMPFNYSNTNRGNHYNTSNYTFTCPVAGDYMVILRISKKAACVNLQLSKNGTRYATLEMQETGRDAGNTNANWHSFCYDFVVPCSANDTLRWEVPNVYSSVTTTGSSGLLDGYDHIYYDCVTYYLIG
mgnify:CR=1 FL=1